MNVSIIYEGSIVLFTPLDDDAIAWFDDNVESAPWQWLGDSLAVDYRMAGPIITAIQGGA